jgi:hypothetical protein
LHGGVRRRTFLARYPRPAFEILGAQASPTERRRPDEHDLVVEQRFAVELRRNAETSDDRELDLVGAHKVERSARCPEPEVDLNGGVLFVEPREGFRQQVRAGYSRGGERELAHLGVAAGRERPARVREQRLGAQDVVGENLSRGRQRDAARAANDQLRAELCFERRNVLRHRRLADEQDRGGREKDPSRATAANARRRASTSMS